MFIYYIPFASPSPYPSPHWGEGMFFFSLVGRGEGVRVNMEQTNRVKE